MHLFHLRKLTELSSIKKIEEIGHEIFGDPEIKQLSLIFSQSSRQNSPENYKNIYESPSEKYAQPHLIQAKNQDQQLRQDVSTIDKFSNLKKRSRKKIFQRFEQRFTNIKQISSHPIENYEKKIIFRHQADQQQIKNENLWNHFLNDNKKQIDRQVRYSDKLNLKIERDRLEHNISVQNCINRLKVQTEKLRSRILGSSYQFNNQNVRIIQKQPCQYQKKKTLSQNI